MVPSSFAVPNSKVSGFGDLALCGLVDPRAQAAVAAIVFVFSVDALKGALIMLLEDCVSGAVAGLQFLSSWSVMETNDVRCSWAAGSGEFVGIMASLGCCSCCVPVELFMSVAALGCDYCKTICFEAAAAAAAFVLGLAHTFLAEPAASALVGFFKIFRSHAAAARAAAVDALHSVEQFLGCVFETFWWMLAFVWYDVGSHMRISGKEDWTFPGLWKDQKDSMVQGKAEGSPIPQASIPEAVAVNYESMCFDGHVQIKGKDRHDIDGSLSLGLGGRRQDGWTSPSVSPSSLRSSAGLDSLSPSFPLALASSKRFLSRRWMGTLWYTGYMSTLWWVTCLIARWMCGSRTLGSWFNLGTPLVTLVLGMTTHYAVMDDSEEERSVIVHNRLTFRVSGRVKRVCQNGCGL